MSLAAVKNNAMAIRKRLFTKKQLLCTAAPAAACVSSLFRFQLRHTPNAIEDWLATAPPLRRHLMVPGGGSGVYLVLPPHQ